MPEVQQPENKAPVITEAQKQEATARVALGVTTKAEAPVQERVDSLSKALLERGPGGMLRTIIGTDTAEKQMINAIDKAGEKDLSDERIKQVSENSFGWGTDGEGKKILSAEEQGRLDDANKRIGEVNEYLMKDFDGLTPDQKRRMLNDVGRMIRSIPALNNLLERMPDKGKSTIEELLRNGEFKDLVKNKFKGTLDKNEKDNKDTKDRVVEEDKKVKEAEEKRAEKEKALKEVTRDITSVNKELEKFALETGKGEKGELLAKMEQLQKEDKVNKSEIGKRQTEITDLDKRIEDLRLEQAGGSDEIGVDKELEIQGLLDRRGILEKEKSEFVAKRKELTDLRKQKKDLETNKIKLDAEKSKLSTEYDDAVTKVSEAKEIFDQEINEKKNDEQNFINEINRTISDSTADYLKNKINSIDEVQVQQAIELDKETKKGEAAEGVAEHFEKKWAQKGAYDKRGIFTSEGTVRADFDRFVQGGLEGLFNPPTDEQKAILENPALKEKYEKQLGESLLLKRLRSGKLSKDDVYRLVDAKWMGGIPAERLKHMTDMIENHKGLQDMVKTNQKAGYFDSEFWTKLKNADNAAGVAAVIAAMLAGLLISPLGAGIAITEVAKDAGIIGLSGATAGVGAGLGMKEFNK